MPKKSKEFRIVGPPGTGKTTTLSRLIAKSCSQYGSEAVLVTSFTKAAARELVSRNLPLNDDRIGTLHALCYRALERPKLIDRELLKDWNASYPSMQFGGIGSNLDDPYGDIESSGAKDGDGLLQELNRLRGLQVPADFWPIRIQNFSQYWADFKDQTFTIDFTDLISRCVEERVPIPHESRVMFLDEVQDFSPLELSLARWWGSSCEELYLGGDDDQVLYRFKGAIPDAFMSPDLPAEQVTILAQSYRVPRAVHAAATAWVEQIENRIQKDYKPRDVEGAVGQLDINYKWHETMKYRLEEWIDAGKTVAILASCSFFLDPVKHKLRDWGFPFWNPYRKTRGDWNPLTGRSGTISASDRVRMYRKPVDESGWWTYRELWEWAGCLKAEDIFHRGAKTLMRRKAEGEETAGLAVEVDDLEQWFADPVAAEKATAGDVGWLQSNLLDTYRKPIGYACNILEARGPKALKDQPKITLGTVHSVKGGEASIVVLFPDLSPAGYQEWTTPGEARDSVRRMFYVGQTRAREELYWAQPVGPSISGYL
ncbi:MAG: ATP-dependent helicase [Fimbriimonadaceae bacterium]|nr:ATP-dependent helicase [Fimbriimonadaceae bacterium]